MKQTRNVITIALTAIMGLTSLPALSCSAAEYTGWGSTYCSPEYDAQNVFEFIVIMWSENENGELTVTGCSPMYSSRVSDYPTSNVVGGFVFNGKLELPSHINGKTVTAISGVNVAKSVGARTVVINENITDISETAFGKGVTVLTTDKENRVAPIYY